MSGLRIATFNLENLDDAPEARPSLAERMELMVPQLERLAADVLCLQEVNAHRAGGEFKFPVLDAFLAGTRYAAYHRASASVGTGERSLVTLSRFPISQSRPVLHTLAAKPSYRRVTASPPDAAAQPVGWERPVLHTVIDVDQTCRLHVINVHFKSKLPTDIPGQRVDPAAQFSPWASASGWAEGSFISSMKRVGQALETRMLVDTLFEADPRAMIAVCGDFNADADDVPLRALRGDVEDTENPRLAGRTLVPCERSVPEPARYSLIFRGRGEMIDHILASRPLLAFFRHTEIHNEVLHDESHAFATDVKYPESDHAPVIAAFDLPA